VSDPYFDTETCVDRLVRVYNKYSNLIVAFDFDDTIYDYHKKGYKYYEVIKLLQRCSNLNFTMILFSCKETTQELNNCADHCEIMGIHVDYLNCSSVMKFSIKPFYNILLDDKAGLGQAYEILKETVDYIELANKEDEK
jgi:hypothetical protein